VPDGASEPTAPSVTVLAEASGAPVRAGPVVVHYAATHWTNAATDSTWERGQAATFTLGSGGPFDGLIGVPVGSRALVLIPASGQTPAIAAVVDVLGQHLDTP
jgi:peptidylprolyl isomerase